MTVFLPHTSFHNFSTGPRPRPSSIFPLFQHAHVENIFSGSLCRRFHYCPKFLKKSIKELLFSRIVGIIIVSGPSGPQYAPVAQLDRALDSDSKGRAFESHRAYQSGSCTLAFEKRLKCSFSFTLTSLQFLYIILSRVHYFDQSSGRFS